MVMTIKKGAKKASIELLLSQLVSKKEKNGIDAYKYCGVIDLESTPEEIQNSLRDEWD